MPNERSATCPAHDDKSPSLSINPDPEGFDGVLLHCHAGCETDDVLGALGLTQADLFDSNGSKADGVSGDVVKYRYVDEEGRLLFIKERRPPKKFTQYQVRADMSRIHNLKGVRRVLYQLPKVLDAIDKGLPVYVCEGEKDADAMTRAGVVATTWTEGAWTPGATPKWRPEYSKALRGADVRIVADRDDSGRHTARSIARELVGAAASVQLLEPAAGKDAFDHLAAGRTVDDFASLEDSEDSGGGGLTALLEHIRRWHDVDDVDHVLFALAVAVAAYGSGEPLWGMLVGPPSSGKTEAIRLLDDVVDERLDELTAPALLSWSRGKTPKKVGVLTRVPSPALVTVGDFSTILASSDRGGRDQLFALLRRVYDGSVTRDVGNAPEALRWEGRLTLLAAVTPAIDDYQTHSDALGPRWLYFRLPNRTLESRRTGAARLPADLDQMRARARQLAATAVRDARRRLPDVMLSEATRTRLADIAVVVAAGRGAVPRDGYGARPIVGMPVIEEPYRLVSQLQTLATAFISLGLSEVDAARLAARAAFDTMPRARLAVLRCMADSEPLTVSMIARRTNVNRRVVRMALEDLRELGLVVCPAEDTADVEDPKDLGTKPRDWELAPGLGALAADVLPA